MLVGSTRSFSAFRLRVHQFGAGRIMGAGLMDAGIALISRS
jgi:hypothetical protein